MYLIYWKWKVGSAVAVLCDLQGISYEIRDDSDAPSSYDTYEVIIPSPWIPQTHPIYSTGRVMCELDFAYGFLPRGFQLVSVTGTDGKSTTAWIMYNILEKEFSVKEWIYLSGNFDIPFSATVVDILQKWKKNWIIVVEISSFMSFAIKKYQSDYSIFTNFKPDHLNWHTSLQSYLDAKMNLMKHTTQYCIMNEQITQFVSEHNLDLLLPENTRIFSANKEWNDSTDWENIKVSGQIQYKLSKTNFSGVHNAMNILASILVGESIGIDPERLQESLKSIMWLPHRLELIGIKWGIKIVEDSKSTSSQSLAAALGSYGNTCNLLLIVWWSNKWDTFDSLAPLFERRVRAVVAIGETKELFVKIAKQKNISHIATDSLIEWIEWLYSQRRDGDILMLSPGCASFGLFHDYLDRANQFREYIKKLPE